MYLIDPSGDADVAKCADCGRWTRHVWGYVETETHEAREAYATYFIRWTDGHPERGAVMAVSIGGWGGSTRPKVMVGLDCAIGPQGPSYMVVDAEATPWGSGAENEHLGEKLPRKDVIGKPLAQEVFALVDAIYAVDPRFQAFVAS